MTKTLDEWICDLRERFQGETLTKHVVRAKITIGLCDVTSGEIQYHSLEYVSKKKERGGDHMKKLRRRLYFAYRHSFRSRRGLSDLFHIGV